MKGRALVREYGATGVLAAVSGAISFAHIHDLAVHHGQSGWRALVYPVAIDAVTVHALTILLRVGERLSVRLLAWVGVVVFTAASLAANLLDAPSHDPIGMGLSAVPAVAFLFSTLLGHLIAHRPDPAQEAASEPEELPQRQRTPRPHRRAPMAASRTPKTGASTDVIRELATAFKATPEGRQRGAATALSRMGDAALIAKGLEPVSYETWRRTLASV